MAAALTGRGLGVLDDGADLLRPGRRNLLEQSDRKERAFARADAELADQFARGRRMPHAAQRHGGGDADIGVAVVQRLVKRGDRLLEAEFGQRLHCRQAFARGAAAQLLQQPLRHTHLGRDGGQSLLVRAAHHLDELNGEVGEQGT
jgi:hypothetical protein